MKLSSPVMGPHPGPKAVEALHEPLEKLRRVSRAARRDLPTHLRGAPDPRRPSGALKLPETLWLRLAALSSIAAGVFGCGSAALNYNASTFERPAEMLVVSRCRLLAGPKP
jgi:hypothetical protein